MLCTSNIIGEYYALDDLESVVRLIPKLKDPDFIQGWTSNVILKAFTMKKCKIGKPLISQLEDLNMQTLWAANYKMGC